MDKRDTTPQRGVHSLRLHCRRRLGLRSVAGRHHSCSVYPRRSVLTAVTRLAPVKQHRPRREPDRDRAPERRTPRVVSQPTLQSASRVPIPTYWKSSAWNFPQVFSEPNLRWSDAVTLLEVRLDRRRQRGNLILLRCDECRMVALSILSSALWESARSADMSPFNFIRLPMISPLVWISVALTIQRQWRHLAVLRET